MLLLEGLYLAWAARMCKLIAECKDCVKLPLIFEHCTKFGLDEKSEKEARDLYWDVRLCRSLYRSAKLNAAKQVICNKVNPDSAAEADKLLTKAITLNPFVGEPHAVLAQVKIREDRKSVV